MVAIKFIFGITQIFTIISSDLPIKEGRMEIFSKAQMEINSIIDERSVLTALERNIPPAAYRNYLLKNKVLILSEVKGVGSNCYCGRLQR